MPNLSPAQTIVLCLDIDGTLIAQSDRADKADFIGSEDDNNASHWVNLLTRIKQRCAALNVHLIVQIITAKAAGGLDVTVDWVARYLHDFLKPLDKQGEWIDDDTIPVSRGSPVQYYAMFHLDEEEPIKSLCDNATLIFSTKQQDIINALLLPPIHVCYHNHPLGSTSKAMVMDTISKHFGEVIPCDNMFLVDDFHGVESDLKTHQPAYQFISSQSCNDAFRSLRAAAFQLLQIEIEERIVARAKQIYLSMNQSDHLSEPANQVITSEVPTVINESQQKHEVNEAGDIHLNTHKKALTAVPTSLRSVACPRSLNAASELDPASKSRDVVVGMAVKTHKNHRHRLFSDGTNVHRVDDALVNHSSRPDQKCCVIS